MLVVEHEEEGTHDFVIKEPPGHRIVDLRQVSEPVVQAVYETAEVFENGSGQLEQVTQFDAPWAIGT